jgi:hypothetical protein
MDGALMTSIPYPPFSSAFALSTALPPDAAQFELETINAFLQDAAAGAIRKLSAYVDANSVRFHSLAAVAPLIAAAADAFRNREFAKALEYAYAAYRQIVMLRAALPELPNP